MTDKNSKILNAISKQASKLIVDVTDTWPEGFKGKIHVDFFIKFVELERGQSYGTQSTYKVK